MSVFETRLWTAVFAFFIGWFAVGLLASWEGERAGASLFVFAFVLVVYAARKLVTTRDGI